MFAHPPNDASKGRAVDSCLEPAAERAPAPPRGLGVAVLRKRERWRVGSPRDRATRRRRRANRRVVVSERTAPEDARRVTQSRRDRSPHPRAAGGDGGARCGAATACRRAEGHGGARRQGHRGVARGCGEAGKISEALAVRDFFRNREALKCGHPVHSGFTRQIWSHLGHGHGGVGLCASPGVRAAPHARVGQRESARASEGGRGGGVSGASTSADSAQISSPLFAPNNSLPRSFAASRPRVASASD